MVHDLSLLPAPMSTSTRAAPGRCPLRRRRYHLASKKDAVNLALRCLAGESLDLDAARALRGSGWDGDLDEMRQAQPT